jgi:hypothetical protein
MAAMSDTLETSFLGHVTGNAAYSATAWYDVLRIPASNMALVAA